MSAPIVLPPGSGPGGTPANVRQPRFGDAVGAILLLVLAVAGYLTGVILSFFGFLLTGVCAARSCNADAGTTAQAIVAITLAVVLVLGAAISIALIVTRRRDRGGAGHADPHHRGLAGRRRRVLPRVVLVAQALAHRPCIWRRLS